MEFDPLKKIKDIVDEVPKVHHADIHGPEIDRNDLFPTGMLPETAIKKMQQTISMLEEAHRQTMNLVLKDTMEKGIIFKNPVQQIEYASEISMKAVQSILDKVFQDRA